MNSTSGSNFFPKVTIAIPTLNRVEYLKLAIESALAQTYPNIELIVSNNASTDGTEHYLETLNDSRLRVLHQSKSLSMLENWNACVVAASGEYFLLLSDDDLLEGNAIEALVAAYREKNDSDFSPGLVYGGGVIINSEGGLIRPMKISPKRESAKSMILGFFQGQRDIWLCGILFRISEIVPGFPIQFTVAPDSAVWIRSVAKYGGVAFVPQSIVRYRVHQNITAKTSVKTWTGEVTELGQLALFELSKTTYIDDNYKHQLMKGIHRLNISTAIGRINKLAEMSKRQALLECMQNLRFFTGLFGMQMVAKCIILLLVPKKLKTWLRKSLRRH
jgi:glycosyltransferase involved in cell wall biosynthesis